MLSHEHYHSINTLRFLLGVVPTYRYLVRIVAKSWSRQRKNKRFHCWRSRSAVTPALPSISSPGCYGRRTQGSMTNVRIFSQVYLVIVSDVQVRRLTKSMFFCVSTALISPPPPQSFRRRISPRRWKTDERRAYSRRLERFDSGIVTHIFRSIVLASTRDVWPLLYNEERHDYTLSTPPQTRT